MNDFDVSKLRSFASRKTTSPSISKKVEENKVKEKRITNKNIVKVPTRKRTENGVGPSNKKARVESTILIIV